MYLLGASPRLAAVGRPKHAALVERRVDDGVEHVRVGRRDGEADPPHLHLGQAAVHLAPGLAGVGGLVDRRLGAAVDQRPHVPAALVGRRVQHVGVARVEVDLADARVRATVEHGVPGPAAVGGLVQAAVAARRPQRSLGRHVDHVGVARVDADHADVLGLPRPMFFQDVPPSQGLVDPVPQPTERWELFSPVPTHTTKGLLGSRVTQPIEYDPWSSKIGVKVVPELTVFHTPPEDTDDVVLGRVGRVHGQVADAARGDRRAHGTKREPRKCLGRHQLVLLGLLLGRRLLRPGGGRQQGCSQGQDRQVIASSPPPLWSYAAPTLQVGRSNS